MTSNGFATANPDVAQSPQATDLCVQILLADDGAISDAGLLGDAPNTPERKYALERRMNI